MRISDWSSDVCSSDLGDVADVEALIDEGLRVAGVERGLGEAGEEHVREVVRRHALEGLETLAPVVVDRQAVFTHDGVDAPAAEIGRASCRDRVCQYV